MSDSNAVTEPTPTGDATRDERVLILAPTGRDAALACAALGESGVASIVCPDIETLCRKIRSGAGAALIAKEALSPSALERLRGALAQQPPWSSLPLIVLTSGGQPGPERRRRLASLRALGSATLLERPLRVATLVSAAQAALAARRRQYELREHLRERERLEAALQAEYDKQRHIAEVLQRSLLPAIAPGDFPGLDVWPVYQAAWQEADIGGDFYDVFALNGDKVALVVGDVSGKGLAAASRTAEVKFALRAFLREYDSPARALDRLNDFLLDGQTLDGQPLDNFVCLALAVLETETGALTAAGAGAESPLMLPRSGDLQPVPGGGPPLGVTALADYEEVRLELGRGDAIVFITDGITEARRGREFFGYEGLVETARRAGASASLPALGEEIVRDAADFAGGRLTDDVCLLLARRV